MTKYKHLFFDLDNTLYDFEANSYMAMKEAFNELELLDKLPSFDQYFKVYSEINAALWAEYREQRMPKDILRTKRHTDSLAQFDLEPEMGATRLDDLYLEKMTTQTELFPNTIDVLAELQTRGYKIHIITNGFKEVQHQKIENTGLMPFLTNVFISEVIQAPKPAYKIFEYAIKSSNARKSESLMIGDSWESDIEGAKKYGIDQVFFQLNKQVLDYTKLGKPTFIITELNDLLKIL